MGYDPKREGRQDAFDTVLQHLKSQQEVWRHTQIPPSTLIDLLIKNVQALKQL